MRKGKHGREVTALNEATRTLYQRTFTGERTRWWLLAFPAIASALLGAFVSVVAWLLTR
jgi:hypothetical protein